MARILIVLLLFFIAGASSAQQKLLMLNGKEIIIKDFSVKNDLLTYKKINGTREKRRTIDKFRVFSVTDSVGKENIIYEADTSFDLSVDQMRIFIQGEQAAMKYYHRPANVVGGVVAGAVGSYLTFYGLPVPILYATISGRFSPKVRLADDAIYPDQKTEEFIEGYKRKARDIKTKQTLISGLIGFALSVTFFSLYEGNVKF